VTLGRRKKELSLRPPGLQPTPGARSLLEYLQNRDIALVVATSADDREMRAILKQGVSRTCSRRTNEGRCRRIEAGPDIVLAALARADAGRSQR
jgi:beta-phosphoglucomutase-like phosphatase (HAD superfamily)